MNNDFDQSFGFLVYDIARLMRERFNERAMAYDLTLAQNRALLHLNRNQGVNQTTLARILDIQPITLVRQLDKLEHKGLIERRADPEDRRMQRLFLTPRARDLIEQLTAIGRAMTDDAFDGVSNSERARVIATLQRIKNNLICAAGPNAEEQLPEQT